MSGAGFPAALPRPAAGPDNVPMPTPLPVDAALPELLAALRAHGAAVLVAPTGAGKTTRVPPALLPLGPGAVILVEPRRVAARAAARRMAAELGCPVGGLVGYQVRFDNQTGRDTRVIAVTPGVLLRRLQADPFLEPVSAVIFDEFHERGIESDLALGLVQLVRETVRPDLRVVVMSATLDPAPVSAYLGGCPTVESRGRSFTVDVRYAPRRPADDWPAAAADATRRALADTPGDVLVFLPGVREIRACLTELESTTTQHDLLLFPLYGDLPPADQDRALRMHPRRKVVVATNVAEASVTVEGVIAVVDTGVARESQFDPALGLDRLVLGPISRAAADQRAGRAGRTAPGVCVRLWDEQSHRARPADAVPEVRRADVAGAVLALAAVNEPGFRWLEAPRPESVAQASAVLRALGALDAAGAITRVGRQLAALPVPPRVGRLLLEAQALGCPRRAAVAAALLTERDPFTGSGVLPDFLDRVRAVEAFIRTGRTGPLHPAGADAVARAAEQFRRVVPGPDGGDDESLARAVLAAYPDRVARRRSPGDVRAILVGGRGARLPIDAARGAELAVCVDVAPGDTEAAVRAAAAVTRDWLAPGLVLAAHEVTFDPAAGKLAARKVTRYLDLILDDVPGHIADETRAADVLAAAAAERLDDVLPAADTPAGQFIARARFLAHHLPDADLPALADADLARLLPGLCRGRRSLADVRAGPWLDAIRTRFTYPQLQLLEREAPTALTVPSGSQITLTYDPGRAPVLAARVQEVFGLADTPRVAAGRVKVVVHLLAPNCRPQQVTDDLASFWRTGYALVRKELRGRYPKHAWPETPTAADAVRGPKRRA